jgi:hypothetical protein
MRLVDAICSRLNRPRRDDPIFGSMLYMGDRLKYWEGKATFTPTGSIVEVFVDGFAEDSMEQQHNFFQRLLDVWPNLSKVITRFLLDHWNESEPGKPVESPWASFKISSLSIPKDSIEHANWEISFVTSDPTRLWTVQMTGLLPQELTVDD